MDEFIHFCTLIVCKCPFKSCQTLPAPCIFDEAVEESPQDGHVLQDFTGRTAPKSSARDRLIFISGKVEKSVLAGSSDDHQYRDVLVLVGFLPINN